ncbi:MAG: hypothetical protein ACK4I8_02120 [Armatimonadota bacterium]
MRKTCLWSVGILLLSVTIASAQKPISVAFLGVGDESGYGGAMFKSQVGDTLMKALSDTQIFFVLDARDKITVPADNQSLAKIANESQTHAAAQAIVKSVSVVKPKGDPKASVVLEATLVPAKMPQIAFKAKAEGKGDDPAEGRAIAKAVAAAAVEVAKQLSTVVALKGQVLLPPVYAILPATHYKDRDQFYERTVRISLDITSGLKVGSEVLILQKGKPVAEGKIVEVDVGSSLVALEKVLPGVKIRTGDEVRVTFIPQYATKLPLPLQKEREYKRVEHDLAWALAIAAAAIGFFGD